MVRLAAEVERVRTASEGERNTTLNRAAFAIGQLVAGGEVVNIEATTRLQAAALEAGLPAGEVEASASKVDDHH